VRLIELTQAFASVANRGIAVTPYGISRVVTADGRVLYNHDAPEQRVLIAPWVAAEMTDLLQSAVLSGTGRAAQIGRPVAGKTGTTQNNHDGWFIGFSSGLTTGVWMGRDDSKPVAGLYGGTAPATAFHDFMAAAVANRPVEQFETQVPMPTWQLEPEEEIPADTDEYINNSTAPLVDADGNPIGTTDDQPIAIPAPPPPVRPPYGYIPPQPQPQPGTMQGRALPPGYPAPQQPQQPTPSVNQVPPQRPPSGQTGQRSSGQPEAAQPRTYAPQ
jgi:penicillin-binding protein 1A